MANLTKKDAQPHIDSNIAEAFEVIDNYLPKTYTTRVREIVPECSAEFIRVVRHNRNGPAKVVAALRKVAQEEKDIITQ